MRSQSYTKRIAIQYRIFAIRYGVTVQETEYSKNIKRNESIVVWFVCFFMISLALKIHVMKVIFNSFIYVKLNIIMIDQTFSKFQSF